MADPAASAALSAVDVRKVAALARLALTDVQVEEYRGRLSAVLAYIDRLRTLDLTDAEPLANVGGSTNRLSDDLPGPQLATSHLLRLCPQPAPDSVGPYIQVPKVIDSGGGA